MRQNAPLRKTVGAPSPARFIPYPWWRAPPMPFPEAVNRLLMKKICMNCSARNPPKAVQCRKCGYHGLRVKSRERSGKTA